MSNATKRYYLHSVLKKKGIRFDAFKKTIYLLWNSSKFEDKHIKRLQNEFNYSVQTEI